MTNLRALSTCLPTLAAACGSPARGLAVSASQAVRRTREVLVGMLPIVRVAAVLACFLLVGSFVSPAGAEVSGVPEAVSPAAGAGEALVELRCPSFSWGGVEGAGGYELVVFGVSDGDIEGAAEPRVVSQARLSQGARSWTPSLGSCLERGGRYAWSVRAVTDGGEGEWSAPALFRVTAGPSMDEVEAAMETLRRHLGEREEERGTPELSAEAFEPGTSPGDERLRERLAAARERRADGGEESAARMERSAEAGIAALLEGTDAPMLAALAEVPVLGSPSLSVSSDIALGASSNLFKDGAPFIHNDGGATFGNTAVGLYALGNVTPGSPEPASGRSNSAFGLGALLSNTSGSRNTASGNLALFFNTESFSNTATGFQALFSNTRCCNTANGSRALYSNTTGIRNTATGMQALYFNTTGSYNTAVGSQAGRNWTTGNSNIAIGRGATGGSAQSGVIAIGGDNFQSQTFIEGISNASGTFSTAVCISGDQLGPCSASSKRFKRDVKPLGDLHLALSALRPVSFRYREEFAGEEDPGVQYGFIAEEVAKTFPSLVTYDDDGRAHTVRYDLLTPLLLNELQREHERNDDQERELAELAALRERVAALEAGELPAAQKRTRWWRRGGSNRDSP